MAREAICFFNSFISTSRLEGALDVVRVEGEAAEDAGIVSAVDREEVAALSEGSAAEGNFSLLGLTWTVY